MPVGASPFIIRDADRDLVLGSLLRMVARGAVSINIFEDEDMRSAPPPPPSANCFEFPSICARPQACAWCYSHRKILGLFPNFKVPHRSRVSKEYLPQIHAQLDHSLKALLASEDGKIALTMDCWSSAHMVGYLGKLE